MPASIISHIRILTGHGEQTNSSEHNSLPGTQTEEETALDLLKRCEEGETEISVKTEYPDYGYLNLPGEMLNTIIGGKNINFTDITF